jgi:hypothetical protein
MRRFLAGIRPLALLLVLAPTPAAAQPRLVQTDQPYVHQPSGMTFPTSVGAMPRIDVIEYSEDGQDVSAGYNIMEPDRRVAFTIYIYPAPPPADGTVGAEARERQCEAEFEGVKAQIYMHPGAKVIQEGSIQSPSPHHPQPGKRAVFSLDGLRDGAVMPLVSEADLFCFVGGKWHIKYRVTAIAGAPYQRELDELMQAIVWPAGSSEDIAAAGVAGARMARLTPASAPHP